MATKQMYIKFSTQMEDFYEYHRFQFIYLRLLPQIPSQGPTHPASQILLGAKRNCKMANDC